MNRWNRNLLVVAVAALVFSGCVEDSDLDNDAQNQTANQTANQTENQSANQQNQGENTDEPNPWDDMPPRPWASTEYGPFDVGYRYESFEYTPRHEPDERPIEYSVWYPTSDTDGDPVVFMDLMQRNAMFDDQQPEVDAFDNAEPDIRQPAPVMVFSHGNGGMSAQSYFWTEFLASHGWIVLAPDHTGNTLMDMDDYAVDPEAAIYRPQDLSALLDHFLDLPADDPLSDTASENIAVSGHSYGGYTTLAITGATFPIDDLMEDCEAGDADDDYCEFFADEHLDTFREGFHDDRFKVGLPQTPGGAEAFRDGVADIEVPTLLWTAAADKTLPNEEEGDPIWQAMSGSDHVRIDFLETGHFTFSNMCTLVSSAVLDDGCGDMFLDVDIAHPLINSYSLEFLRLHLLDDEDDAGWFESDHQPRHENIVMYFK